jgi:hypothetical protein
MMRTMPLLTLSGALAVAAFAAAPVAAAMPVAPLQPAATDLVPVYHRGAPHRRTRVTVYPRRYVVPGTRYYYDDPGQYPYSRGFGDRNPVPRANMRGCTVDLGYGRYERCE